MPNPQSDPEVEELERLWSLKLARSENPVAFYEPWGEQAAFHRSPARTRLLISGNRSGKTEAAFAELVMHAMGYRWDGTSDNIKPPPGDYLLIVTDRSGKVGTVVAEKIETYINPQWLDTTRARKGIKNATDGYPAIIFFKNGSTIHIRSPNQDAEGPAWSGICYDEPPPESNWIANRRGLVDHGGREWFAMTPLRCPWIYNRLYKNADGLNIEAFHLNSMDNPYIAAENKQAWYDSLRPDERQARIYGKFSHLTGAIFPEFTRSDHVCEPITPELGWPVFQVVDPHSRRPYYISWWTIDPRGHWYCFREWPHEDFFQMKTCGLSLSDYVGLFAKEEMGLQVTDRIMDPNFAKSRSHTTGLTLADEFANVGVIFETNIDNDIALGHERIRERLRTDKGEPTVHICRNCRNMTTAFEIYSWNEKDLEASFSAKERPGDAGKDQIDTFRYLCDYGPRFAMGEVALTESINPNAPSSKGMGYGY
jgi:hypothetical protein